MAGDIAAEALRDLVGEIVAEIARRATHPTLARRLAELGLPTPATAGEGTKAELAAQSLEALPDARLPYVAERIVTSYDQLDAARCHALQDRRWAVENHPTISKRVRREIARALDLEDFVDHYDRFRALLGSLFDLEDSPFAFVTGSQTGLGAEIDRHVGRFHGDWSAEELCERLGAFDASDRRFALLLEGLVSADTLPDESRQRRIVDMVNSCLRADGLELRETGMADGYPVFVLIAIRLRSRRPKNLAFASPNKPDFRITDAIDNDIEILADVDEVLVYDRPITVDGVRWMDLQTWWQETRQVTDSEAAKTQLYQRLGQSLPTNSRPQRMLFDLYHDIYRGSIPALPALLPEVWLHWDPKTVRTRGVRALLNHRMDFLLLFPHGQRIVLEVDGQQHYAIKTDDEPPVWNADPATYAKTMRGSRELTAAGYQVYRFGAHELRHPDPAREVLRQFFDNLFREHNIAAVAQ
jgi:very-short-patch-repair endonuclease